jgi:hypothetical protein
MSINYHNNQKTGKMTRLNTEYLINELTDAFPYNLTLTTRDTHTISHGSYWSMGIYEDGNNPIIIYFEGSMISKNNIHRGKKFDKWVYQIEVLEKNQTQIKLTGFQKKNVTPIVVSSETYSTREIFKDCLTVKRINKLEHIFGRIN